MFRYVFAGLVIMLSLLSGQNSDSLIDGAIQLYETRHLNMENLAKSHEMLQGIVGTAPQNVEANYELAKVLYLVGDEAKTKKEKLARYAEGMSYAKIAIKLDDNSAWAHFWYVVNLGRSGQTKGVLNSLGSVPEIKRETDKVLKIDSLHTGTLDVRAMLYYELPGILGGNLNKSLEALNKGIAIDSNYSLLYLDMGKVYMKKKDYEKARWYLDKCIAITEPTYEADFVLDDKPDALRLLKEIEGK